MSGQFNHPDKLLVIDPKGFGVFCSWFVISNRSPVHRFPELSGALPRIPNQMRAAVAAVLASTARRSLPRRLLQSDLLRSPWSTLQQRGVKVHGSDVRPGNVVERKGRLYEVVRADHNQQGRGSAMIQVELRDVESGNKVNARFNTDESVEKVFVEEKSFMCMCTTDDEVALIDTNTFEQMDVKRDLFGKAAAFLKEDMKVWLRLFNDRPLSGSVPKRVVCTVVDTPPHVKGASVTPVEKRALLDNGLTLKVPAFIETGEVILVNTAEHTYISRAKE